MTVGRQVKDDPGLLERMMRDMDGADVLYRPTNYWEYYEGFFLPELRRHGLKDFRRRRNSILSSFGATDLPLSGELKYEGKHPVKGTGLMIKALLLLMKKMNLGFRLTESPELVTRYFYAHVKAKFEKNGVDMSRCPTTDYGNPEDLIQINDTIWSLAHLQICSMFIDAFQDIGFKTDMVFCEIGPGLGRNAEVLGKLYENATLLLFDIPPQLYVANQYLSSVFGERVIGYDQAVRIDAAHSNARSVKGKIIILPSWKIPAWADTEIEIFWNSASFQEMEPNVVRNYLSLVSAMGPRFIYLNELPGGNYWGEWQQGSGGIRQPIREEDYTVPLLGRYVLRKQYFTDYFFDPYSHTSYIFQEQ